jgi:hypothetical protein
MERAQVRFPGLVLLPEVFPRVGVSLILKAQARELRYCLETSGARRVCGWATGGCG